MKKSTRIYSIDLLCIGCGSARRSGRAGRVRSSSLSRSWSVAQAPSSMSAVR